MPDADVNKLPNLNDLSGTLADRVYFALKSAIMSLDFVPGSVIRKAAICEQLEISRSPVSFALSRLSDEGLVEIVPQSGSRVTRLSIADIKEEAFLREALEVAATRHAAQHRSEEILARLTRNIEMQKLLIVDLDREDFIKTDIAFHELIMATTQNSRLPGTVRTLSPSVDRARLLLVPELRGTTDTVQEHIQILDAIGRQDETAAQEAMRHHLQQLFFRLEPLEAARPDLFSK